MHPSSASPEPQALSEVTRISPQAEALLRLPPNACRWLLGQGWCGRPTVDGAYCAVAIPEA